MTYEEALHEISVMVFRNTDNCEMRISKECYRSIVNALEKQIPKKPTNYAIDNNGYMIYDCECSSCKCSQRELYPYAYCSHCGQAIDWSDGE